MLRTSAPLIGALGSMNRRLLAGLYFALWAVLLVCLVYFAVRNGYSILLSLLAASLLFQIANGSLAYMGRLRRLEPGETLGQSYLQYLFFPNGLKQTIEVPRILRLVLGFVVTCGGILFLLLGAYFATFLLSSSALKLIIAGAGALLVGGLGAAISYVGFRLLIAKNGEPLFGKKRPKATDGPHAA